MVTDGTGQTAKKTIEGNHICDCTRLHLQHFSTGGHCVTENDFTPDRNQLQST